jgi:hypothetical protein
VARFRIPEAEIEVPASTLGSAEVESFVDYLHTEGEMSRGEAETFTRALLATLVVDVGRWCARVTRENLEAVLRLRSELKIRYAATLRLLRAGRPLPGDLQPEAFREVYVELVSHMGQVVGFDDQVLADPEALRAQLGLELELPAPDEAEAPAPPDEPPGPYFDSPAELLAEAERQRVARDPDLEAAASQGGDPLGAYNRDLTRVHERFGDVPVSRRRVRAVPAPPRALAEQAAAEFFEDHLRAAGITDVRVERQPILEPHTAAERALGHLDPVRGDLHFEMPFEVPDGLLWPGQRGQWIKPDGVEFTSPADFFFREHKGHELVPDNGFFDGPAGDRLLADMELRARMAQRIPACRGWRYTADLPELRDVFRWTIETLRGRRAGNPPESISPEFARLVQVLSDAPGVREWAEMLEVQ